LIAIELERVSKGFHLPDGRAVAAVRDLSLSVNPGEFFFILGPSGCGKTTLLRLIAGFMAPDQGKIFLGGVDVTSTAAYHRGAAMVFQNYALFPHLNVYENVAYGLRVRKLPGSERDAQVKESLKLVRMEEFAEAYPGQLSGGQQQRIALARALVIRPQALLLDEPLSNLDARLREEMRGELREIHGAAKTTTIYVTHDQKEALSLADRIALLNEGRVEQVGRPADLYTRPQNRFVAEFVGEANLIPGTVTGIDPWGELNVLTALGLLSGQSSARKVNLEQRVLVMIRPERVRLSEGSTREGIPVEARVVSRTYLGEKEELELVAPDNLRLKARVDPRHLAGVNQGDLVELIIPGSGLTVIPE
jgi:ABC-type Fe3+/spermidine/putrescine transport system ATPase subunit